MSNGRGYAVVDPGLPGVKAWRSLQRRLRAAGISVGSIHTILVTHTHPDHSGAAGRLAKAPGAEVRDPLGLPTLVGAAGRWIPVTRSTTSTPTTFPTAIPSSRPRRGTGIRPLPPMNASPGAFAGSPSNRVFAAPTPTRRVTRRRRRPASATGNGWRCTRPGHTIEHLCLYDPEGGTFLSGDHVLPTITPHISGLGEGRDPLRYYIDSLDKVADLPGIALVLPAHGHPFTDLGERVDSIKAHHVERMEKLRQASLALGPTTVAELSHHLFRKAVWGAMAESETYAHLEHLRLAGEPSASRTATAAWCTGSPPRPRPERSPSRPGPPQ